MGSFLKHHRKLIVVAGGLCALFSGGSAWAVSSISAGSASGPSSPSPYPPSFLSGLPPDKSAELTTPTTAYTGPPLNNSVPACAGASSCRIEGIVPAGQAPWNATDFAIQNEYVGTYQGQNIEVYAGEALNAASGSATSVAGGGLRIVLGDAAWQQYLAPNTPGWVDITSVDGSVLNLQSQNGTALSFDLDNNTFGS
jgi:hypothetical protein